MNIIQKISSKLTIGSLGLIGILTLYFGFALNIRFWQFVLGSLEITNVRVALFAFSLLFFITAPLFLLFNLIVVKKIGKPLIALLLVLSAGTQYMMLRYGVYIDKNMIQNVFETNTREALDLVTFSFVTWVFFTGILPAILLCLTKIRYRPVKQEIKVRAGMCLICLLIVALFAGLSFKEYASYGRNNRSVKSLINGVNYVAGTIGYVKKIRLSHRQFQVLDSSAKLEPYEDDLYTVLIFVLGETARAANFSLNGYQKETNPLLKKQDIVYFHEMTSCGTATAVSVPCMFSHMLRSDFDSADAKYTENLIDLLQTAGYDVIWKENDDGCKGVCDRVAKTEMMVQTNNPKFCNGQYCHDEVLLEDLPNILKNIKQDTVIVLHTMGSHGPSYYNRYPDAFKKFTPTCDTADIQNCTLPEIVNTYDNTILYTDYIVSSAIDILKQYPQFEAGLLYVSDHGESLGENNIYLHGMPYKIAPDEQTEVPMILWMSENMKKWDYVDYACMKDKAQKNVYSHDNLFHSILGLLEVDTKVYRKELDFFNGCRTKKLNFHVR